MAAPSARSSTHCPYCALQCGVHLVASGGALEVMGDPHFPVNQGGLCAKGWTAAATLTHPDRLRTPLARTRAGVLEPVGWDDALDAIARGFRQTQASHGRDAVAVFGGGSLTNEKAYLLGKFARVALGTANIDYNGRFCMSSAAAAGARAFGIDRGLPFPLADIERAETILLVGGNMAETMPPVMRYFEAQQRNAGALIVVDPRRSATAQWSTLHLRLRPGSDAALANGLVHLLIREGMVDAAYIQARTEGFDDVRQRVAAYWPERVEGLTGVPQRDLVEAAKKIGNARAVMVLTSRGAEQQSHGVDNVLAFINVALAVGAVGRPFSGFGTLTGQGNGQGGREHGQKADQLPGYRHISDPDARRHMASVWGIDESDLPHAGKPAYELLDSAGRDGGIRSLFVVGSNPVVSAPNALSITARLAQLDFLVVSDFFLSETAALAHVVLPAAQFAEEDGTMTNLEGRVIRRRRAIDPPEGARDDIDVLCALADRMGKGRFFSFANSAAVFDELRRATRGAPADYSGITYERIDKEDGVFWPCPAEDHPGTPRLFIDRFPTPTGRAHFSDVEHLPSAEPPDESFPLHLTTGRVLAHYQSGTQTRRVAALCEMAPEPLAELHPQTAKRHGVADGTPVTLRTRRGTGRFTAKVTPAVRPDTIFVPFHWGGEGSANRLTIDAVDPVSGMPEFKNCAVRVEAGGTDIDD
jgi:assimilatory nitrate reductase catalytic subunit